jgi:hypothetical protein
MNLWNETKSIPISRLMVWEAYQKVRSNKGSAGIYAIGMQEFDAKPQETPLQTLESDGIKLFPPTCQRSRDIEEKTVQSVNWVYPLLVTE